MNTKTFEQKFKELFFDRIELINILYIYDLGELFYSINLYSATNKYLGAYYSDDEYFWISNTMHTSLVKIEKNLSYGEIYNIIKDHLNSTNKLTKIVSKFLDMDFEKIKIGGVI